MPILLLYFYNIILIVGGLYVYSTRKVNNRLYLIIVLKKNIFQFNSFHFGATQAIIKPICPRCEVGRLLSDFYCN